jgi:hypothetical protein
MLMPTNKVIRYTYGHATEHTDDHGNISIFTYTGVAKGAVATSTPIQGDFHSPTNFRAVTVLIKPGGYYQVQHQPRFDSVSVGTWASSFRGVALSDGLGTVRVSSGSKPYPTVLLPSRDRFDNAMSKALEKVAQVNFDALTALAEARGTANTIASLASTALHGLLAVKKLDIKTLRKMAKDASKRSDLPSDFRKKARRAARAHAGSIKNSC